MKNKYFWNQKWFWISLTSLAAIGLATFTSVTNSGKMVTATNLKKLEFADGVLSSSPNPNTLSGYGYHAPRTVNYVSWADESPKKIIDVFPTLIIANRILASLQNTDPTKFPVASSSISSDFLKTDLAKIKTLNLSNLDLTNIDEIFNPALAWSGLTAIELSNNNFNDYVLKFDKTKMPKLYSVTARNAHLNQMVDVSSYVTDPFDQAASGTEARTTATKEYAKALNQNVPRYFDLFQNNIPQIPKYYLKIALAYFNLGSNKLGSGTTADPQGVYGLPWYSMASSTNTNTIGIADPSIRGPYGINLYNTGDKTGENYTYSDEVVGRWRAQPYPIKGLRFEQYNLTPSATGALDSGVTFPASDDTKATGGTDPFFNFGGNNLVNIPIFRQANVVYDENSTISPQNKSAVVFAGLDDYKKSKNYSSVTTGTKPEMVSPQPDMIYPIIATWAWFNQQQNDTYFDQGMQGLYYPRSFNGFKQFAISQDSRSSNNQWDNSILTGDIGSVEGGVAKWTTAPVGIAPGGWSSLLTTNLFGSSGTDGSLTFSNSSSTNYYKKWTALRTFPLTPKTFSMKSNVEKWSNANSTTDGNLYWDTNLSDGIRADAWKSPWSGAQTSDTLWPNGKKGKVWFYQTLTGHDVRPRRNGPGKTSQFLGTGTDGSSITDPYILGFANPSYFSNLTGENDFGTLQATATPYTQGLSISAPGYNYHTNYQVVKKIETSFRSTSNFPSSLDASGFDLAKYKKDGKPVFAQSITANDIKDGIGAFWKSNFEFDQTYMNTLDPSQIKIDQADLAAGKLTYSFRVYSPGYSDLGRLFKDGDGQTSSVNDNSPTLDFEVKNTISGFAIPKFQMKGATGSDFADVPTTGSLVVNNVFTQTAPADFLSSLNNRPISGDKNDQTLKTKIAKEFQTTYLGNYPADAETNQGVAKQLDSKFVEITNINNSEGTISFKVNVPDYVFINGNRLVFPEKYKNLTFIWTGLSVAQITIKGSNVLSVTTPGLTFLSFNKDLFPSIKNKAASQITAQDIVNLNVIESTRTDWLAIKSDTTNLNQYFQLNPDDVSGTLNWVLRLPGDNNVRSDGLLPLTAVVGWSQFANQSTTITWKPSVDTSQPLKTYDVLLNDIEANPNKYFQITNGRESGTDNRPFTTSDFDFSSMKTASILNSNKDSIQVIGIRLKNYYLNGVWMDGSASTPSSAGLLVPTHTFATQKPYYQATFQKDTAAEGHAAIWKSAAAYYNKNINDPATASMDNEALVKKLSSSEIKQLLVNNNVSPLQNVLKVTITPAEASFNFSEADLLYKNNKLSDSIVANPLTGTLSFEGLSVKNWISNNSNTPEAAHKLPVQTYTFKKLSNEWKWAGQIPWQITNLSFNVLANELKNPNSAKQIIDYFNVGQKYYDNDGILQNAYTVDPSLVILNPYLGTLTFKPKAISISNWVNDGVVSLTPHVISEEKVYTFANKLETQFFANIHLTKGVNGSISDWVRVVKGDDYNSASETKKAEYLAEFNQIQMPNYENVSAEQGISLTNRYLNFHELRKISAEDLTVINNLKVKTSGLEAIDFSNYFYVPKYLLFLSLTDENDKTENRTFAIAQTISTTSLTTAIQLSNIYIINYYQNGEKIIKKIPNILFTGFLSAVSTVIFNEEPKNPNTNLLATAWENLSATQIKERLDYLTANRNNIAVNGTSRYKAIQTEWVSTFTFKNIPYDGVRDQSIAYPVNVVADDYSRTLIVNQLLFPYFSQTISATSPDSLVFDRVVNDPQIWLTKVGNNSFIQETANFNEDRYQKIPSFFLQSLGLQEGEQTDGAQTWKKLVSANVYQLVGNQPLINNFGSSQTISMTPSVSIGKIRINNQLGTITFEDVKGYHVWVDGKQAEIKDFPNLTLNLGLQSTNLLRNANNIVERWLNSTSSLLNSSISNLLIEFNQKILDGSFTLNQFNAMLNNSNAFFSVSNPGDGSDTRIQVAPNLKPADAFHLDILTGEISFQNLEIINGYLNNVKVAKQAVHQKIVFNLGWNYSTNFQASFESLLSEKKLFNSSTTHAASVLMQNPQQLLDHLNFQELEGQLEAPTISVSSNPILGQLTFNVHFQNYYKNGVNYGSRNFNYNFNNFQQTLPAIIGGSIGGVAGIILILIAWYIFHRVKNKDRIMIKTNKKDKK